MMLYIGEWMLALLMNISVQGSFILGEINLLSAWNPRCPMLSHMRDWVRYDFIVACSVRVQRRNYDSISPSLLRRPHVFFFFHMFVFLTTSNILTFKLETIVLFFLNLCNSYGRSPKAPTQNNFGKSILFSVFLKISFIINWPRVSAYRLNWILVIRSIGFNHEKITHDRASLK